METKVLMTVDWYLPENNDDTRMFAEACRLAMIGAITEREECELESDVVSLDAHTCRIGFSLKDLFQPRLFADILIELGKFGVLYTAEADYSTESIGYIGVYRYDVRHGLRRGVFMDYDAVVGKDSIPDDPTQYCRALSTSATGEYNILHVDGVKTAYTTMTCPNCHAPGHMRLAFNGLAGSGELSYRVSPSQLNLSDVFVSSAAYVELVCDECKEYIPIKIDEGSFDVMHAAKCIKSALVSVFPSYVTSCSSDSKFISDTRAVKTCPIPEVPAWQVPLLKDQTVPQGPEEHTQG